MGLLGQLLRGDQPNFLELEAKGYPWTWLWTDLVNLIFAPVR